LREAEGVVVDPTAGIVVAEEIHGQRLAVVATVEVHDNLVTVARAPKKATYVDDTVVS
jgi:hypothetical protein